MRADRVLIWGWLWALVSCTQKLGPDIFSRGRILDCGRVLERDAWPAMDWRAPFGEWEERNSFHCYEAPQRVRNDPDASRFCPEVTKRVGEKCASRPR